VKANFQLEDLGLLGMCALNRAQFLSRMDLVRPEHDSNFLLSTENLTSRCAPNAQTCQQGARSAYWCSQIFLLWAECALNLKWVSLCSLGFELLLIFGHIQPFNGCN
jgi:hypothetical protein